MKDRNLIILCLNCRLVWTEMLTPEEETPGPFAVTCPRCGVVAPEELPE